MAGVRRRPGRPTITGVLDLHFVAPGLAVGAAYPMHAAARLAMEHGIARVVDLRVEARDDEHLLRVHGIRLLHLPTGDTRAISQEMLRDGVAFVSGGLDAGERVLVHCQYGIGRSALLALCTLVARGEAPLAALERVKRGRPVISPSPEQLEALRTFAARVREERGASWEVPTTQALAAIAWRHLLGGADASTEYASAASTRSG
jgi:protein-tyrosine phosphatase